jgi:hypothetical protein
MTESIYQIYLKSLRGYEQIKKGKPVLSLPLIYSLFRGVHFLKKNKGQRIKIVEIYSGI